MDNLRLCISNEEFSKKILDTINNNEKFLVWKSFEDHRVLSKCLIDSVSFLDDDLFLNIVLDDEVKLEKVFYFYNEDSFILFKAELEDVDNKRIRVKVTDKKYLKENRKSKRVEFNTLQVKIELKTKPINKRDKGRTHQVLISNISDSGLGFIISRGQSLLFQEDLAMTLTKIEKIELPQGIEGKIIHVTLLENNSDESGNAQLMVGVKFNKSSELLKAVIDEVKKAA
jgi:hypothetical protein